MKRLNPLLLAAIICLAAAPAQGQTQFGVRGGLNYANAEVEGDLFSGEADAITTWHAGLVAEYDISSWFTVQTGAWYSKKGFDVEENSLEVRVNYVEIPILWIIKIPGNVQPRFQLGAVLSLETACSLSGTGVNDQPCEEQSVIGINTKGADTGVIFGGGVEFPFGPGSALIDVFYNIGLTNIAEINEFVDSVKNRTWYLSLGYLLSLGG